MYHIKYKLPVLQANMTTKGLNCSVVDGKSFQVLKQ